MYFDGCDFDPTYFDASVCAPSGGRGGKGGRRRVMLRPLPPEEPYFDDDDLLTFT